MQLVEIIPRLFLVKFPSQYLVTSTFMRMQEYYESPHLSIRRKAFTWEDFIDAYVHNGIINYWKIWAGFNIPGNAILDFFHLFNETLTHKEQILWDALHPAIDKYGEGFYLIGVYKDKDITHEEAHGLFYLNKDYRNEVKRLVGGFSPRYIDKLCRGLAKQGYCPEVFMDEIQAYAIDNKQRKFMDLFKKYRNRSLDK